VVTGDDDTVVPVRASRRVAQLLVLRVEAVREMPEPGTLVKKIYKNNKWEKKIKVLVKLDY
jgi:hypothetical protein